MAYLFAITLLGCWGVMIPTKMWEGREVDKGLKRLTMLVMGMILGIGALALGTWFRTTTTPAWHMGDFDPRLVSISSKGISGNVSAPAAFIAFFGMSLALMRWWKITARDRPARFRFWPVIATGAVAGLLGALVPTPPNPWGALALALIAMIVQLVSPWDRAAADYARETRRRLA
jgi:hypothetical protein